MTVALSRVSVPFDYKGAGFKSIDELVQPVYKAAGQIESSKAEIQSGVIITEYGKRLNHPQTFILGQEVTKKVGSKTIPFSLQTSYNRVQTDPNYRKKLLYKWNHTSELLLQKTKTHKSGVIAIPEIEIKGDEILYTGELIEVEINRGDKVVDVLEKAGVFKQSRNKFYDNEIRFDDNGLSSVRSYWGGGVGCFGADAYWPSYRGDDGLAAFELVGPSSKIEEPKTREVAETEYQEFLKWKEQNKLKLSD